ncbi:uncharacterized protein LY89DRAFT_669403 [Mollisia scopiformis]|uniref:Uncharacterized protein n=1 Tax=Mollisia scopiformis TaxID=149040 RepID=A0A194XB34_MOLSC|nr:uncharacterized protein LY89DRAFT_669403 [Mollisia scopiformis]KUJ16967.1 hypothetical protein LY89DRAFT_669403 [Mollisia scopiformis]
MQGDGGRLIILADGSLGLEPQRGSAFETSIDKHHFYSQAHCVRCSWLTSMASFGFGIGDVILACQGVIFVYQRCKNAPKEIDDVAEDVKRMEATLGLLGSVIRDEKSFIEDHTEDM